MRVTTLNFSTTLQEPTGQQVVDLLNQKLATETDRQNLFFAAVCSDIEGVSDPQDWSFEERCLVLGQYIATYNTNGSPDFCIGADGKYRYSQYLLDESPSTVVDAPAFELANRYLRFRPLTGRMIGVLEGQCGHRAEWVVGIIAAMSQFLDEDPDHESTIACEQRINKRIKWIYTLSASDLNNLIGCWEHAKILLSQYFDWHIQDQGAVVLPKEVGLPPTRFCTLDAFPATLIYALGESTLWSDLAVTQDQEWSSTDFGNAPDSDQANQDTSVNQADQDVTTEGAA